MKKRTLNVVYSQACKPCKRLGKKKQGVLLDMAFPSCSQNKIWGVLNMTKKLWKHASMDVKNARIQVGG